MAGAGPEGARIEALARGLRIEARLRWPGYVQASETIGLHAITSAKVLASAELPFRKETWDLTVNEAMHQGVSVIVSAKISAGAILRVLGDASLRARLSGACLVRAAEWTQPLMALDFAEAIRKSVRAKVMGN